jgi:hypothetical protein
MRPPTMWGKAKPNSFSFAWRERPTRGLASYDSRSKEGSMGKGFGRKGMEEGGTP